MNRRRVSVLVIGGGQCGLAASYYLTSHAIDHVVIERGEIANSWKKERWDSLRLLTPNWLTTLPGMAYDGKHPEGFMTAHDTADFLDAYQDHIDAPVVTHTPVQSLRSSGYRYEVETEHGTWLAPTVVIASGYFSRPRIPDFAAGVPDDVMQLTPMTYKSTAQLKDGGTLVVGASATGLQLAEEIRKSGQRVLLACGEHVRLPRHFRGKDIFHWLHATGRSDESIWEVDDLIRARRVPSPQLVGDEPARTLNLNHLIKQGVEIVGRLRGIDGSLCRFSGDLRNICNMADLKMTRFLRSVDADFRAGDTEDTEPTFVPKKPRLAIDLKKENISNILWATGLGPDFSWLRLPVFDRRGLLIHDGGIVQAPGIYTMGATFMRRRKSSFIHGVEEDARDITEHLVRYLSANRLTA